MVPKSEQPARPRRRTGLAFGLIGGLMISAVVVGAIVILVTGGTQRTAIPVLTARPDTATPSPSEQSSVDQTSAEPSSSESSVPTPTRSATASKTATTNRSPSSPVVSKMTTSNLPRTRDMEWQKAGDWLIDGTRTGLGPEPVSTCISDDLAGYDGTVSVLRRDYTLPDNGRGTAVALNYDTTQAAGAAFLNLTQAAQGCRAALQSGGFTHVAKIKDFDVVIPEGITGLFYEASYRPSGQDQTYESIGLSLAGNRVLLLSMTVIEPDSHWSYSAGGSKPVHPMFRTLPKAAERLTL